MTASNTPDRSVSDDALASGSPAGDGGFDPRKPFRVRGERMHLIGGIELATMPGSYRGWVQEPIGRTEMRWDFSGVAHHPSRNFDLINTPTPTIPPTPAGDGELRPCPFCGGFAQVTTGETTLETWPQGSFSRVYCTACQTRQLFHKDDAAATEAWNRRSAPTEFTMALELGKVRGELAVEREITESLSWAIELSNSKVSTSDEERMSLYINHIESLFSCIEDYDAKAWGSIKSSARLAVRYLAAHEATVPPTPAGDMVGEDDAAFVESMNRKTLGAWVPAEKDRLLSLARKGARREPVANSVSVVAGSFKCAFCSWTGDISDVAEHMKLHLPAAPSPVPSDTGSTASIIEAGHKLAKRTGRVFVPDAEKIAAFEAAIPSAAPTHGAGSGGEPVALLREEIIDAAQFYGAFDAVAIADRVVKRLKTAPPASVDAVAVVTDEMVDAAWIALCASDDGQGKRKEQMKLVIKAALRAAQQSGEARS